MPNSALLPIGLLSGTIFISMCALPARAESLPASVRACAAESDSLRRLVCYDREVARFTDPSAAPGPPPVAEAKPAAPPSSQAVAAASASKAEAAVPGSPAIAVAPGSSPQNEVRHLTAHVVSIDNTPGALVVRLDNHQIWAQAQATDADLNLRVGDPVTIDKSLGGYWLAGRYGGTVKVRQIKSASEGE
jgi:hypothetical protein